MTFGSVSTGEIFQARATHLHGFVQYLTNGMEKPDAPLQADQRSFNGRTDTRSEQGFRGVYVPYTHYKLARQEQLFNL